MLHIRSHEIQQVLLSEKELYLVRLLICPLSILEGVERDQPQGSHQDLKKAVRI